MQDFEGKHIWIVGASSGIGRALAKQLAGCGARLALSARRKDELESLNLELGGNHSVYPLDVTDSEMVTRTASAIQASFPQLDSVIFMAAVYVPSGSEARAPEMVYSIVNVNLTGAIYVSNAVLPILEAQHQGQLVLCASVAGYRGLPGGQPYSATKSGLINFAESLRVETDKTIDIKVINSGFVKTRITDKNDFKMPMIISPEQAAKAIVKGLQSRAFEIHFPKKFTYLMKCLRLLPISLYFLITRRLR